MKRQIALLATTAMLLGSNAAAPPAGDAYEELLKIHAEARKLELGRIEDLDAEDFRSRDEAMKDASQRLKKLDLTDWPVDRRIDFLLVRSLLAQIQFEHEVSRPWSRDPGFYVDRLAPIPFAELPLESERLADFRRRLENVPSVAAAAKANLTEGAGELTNLAVRNLEKADGVGHGHPWRAVPPPGVIGWYEDLLGRVRSHHPELTAQAVRALESARDLRDWLKVRRDRMNRPSGVGADHYSWYLKHVRLMPFTAEEALVVGERELARGLSLLALEQHRNRGLPDLRPAASAEEYERRIREADRHVRDFIREKEILTIPDFVGEFGHNVPWIVRPGGRRNFWEEIQFRDPRPDHVHAVIPGHRFDALVHERDERPIRGAFFDSARVEGWAFYLEETMLQLGLLENLPRTRELFYIFHAARAVRNRAEIGLHTNQVTVEEAVLDMVENIPYMDEDVARVDCEIYLRRPGYGISYLMGKVQIEELLAERKRQLGDNFRLGSFHDEFLASGWIPVSLIRWEMTGLADEIRDLAP